MNPRLQVFTFDALLKSGRRTRSNRGLLFRPSSRRRRLSQTGRLYVAIPYALMFWRWVSPALPTLRSSTGELSALLRHDYTTIQRGRVLPFVCCNILTLVCSQEKMALVRPLDFWTRAAHVTTCLMNLYRGFHRASAFPGAFFQVAFTGLPPVGLVMQLPRLQNGVFPTVVVI